MDNHYLLLITHLRVTCNERCGKTLLAARGRGINKLHEIAKQYGFSHYSSVSGSIARFDRQINEEAHLAKLMRKADNMINQQTLHLSTSI